MAEPDIPQLQNCCCTAREYRSKLKCNALYVSVKVDAYALNTLADEAVVRGLQRRAIEGTHLLVPRSLHI